MRVTSWTYSGDPTNSEVDEVRFTLQDTDTSFQLLQDEELEYLIGFWMPRVDSLIFVASVAAEVVSRKFTGIVNVSADGVSVDTATLAERYHTMAVRLRDEYKQAQIGEINIDNLLWPTHWDYSVAPLRFGIGLDDNPEAGLQDYGNYHYDAYAMESIMSGLWW